MSSLFRRVWRSLLRAPSWARPCRAHGLLPPPLWGRGGKGGDDRFSICGHPPPCPSPAGGEETLWRCLRAACATLVAATLLPGLTGSALSQTPPVPQARVTIGYVDITGDPRHEPIKAYERLVIKQRDPPFAGAQVGIEEAQALS